MIESDGCGGAVVNSGFNGICQERGKYDLSLFAKSYGEEKRRIAFKVSLCDSDGKELCSAKFKAGNGWSKQTATFKADASVDNAVLAIEPLNAGKMAVDMVSLFPRDTFKGRRNGLRRDLADSIAALCPRFVRFPGGCVAHGDGLGNIYRWKNTIRPVGKPCATAKHLGIPSDGGIGLP